MKTLTPSFFIFLFFSLSGCSTPTRPISFFSLNIANGAGPAWRTADARAAQAGMIARQGIDGGPPDVVALEEVDVGLARSGGIDTARAALGALADRGTYIFGKTCDVTASGGLIYGAVPGGGILGNALWVSERFRVLESWVVNLDYGVTFWPRAAILARVSDGTSEFTIAATHLATGSDRESNEIRAREIEEVLGFPVDVFLGDMNAMPEEVSARVGELTLASHSTPGTGGSIDQIWWNGFSGTGGLVPTFSIASDHSYGARAVGSR